VISFKKLLTSAVLVGGVSLAGIAPAMAATSSGPGHGHSNHHKRCHSYRWDKHHHRHFCRSYY